MPTSTTLYNEHPDKSTQGGDTQREIHPTIAPMENVAVIQKLHRALFKARASRCTQKLSVEYGISEDQRAERAEGQSGGANEFTAVARSMRDFFLVGHRDLREETSEVWNLARETSEVSLLW